MVFGGGDAVGVMMLVRLVLVTIDFESEWESCVVGN